MNDGKKIMRLDKLINTVRGDADILAVFLFGSLARGRSHKNSDVDICLVMKEGFFLPIELSQKKFKYLKSFDVDVQIFQQLPLYIRKRIIQDGKKLFCSDDDSLYQLVFRTISEFENFRGVYYSYLREVESVR